VTVLKHHQAAALVRDQVTSGALPPGAPAPSGAQLARITGYSVLTCRRALRTLVTEGTLTPGTSRNARPRVPGADPGGQALAAATRALSAALVRHRRAAGLTQPKLAALIGLSVTTIGHAETGRTWQGRPFWEQADSALHANGELLRLHDAYRAAQAATPDPATGQPPSGQPATRHQTGPARPPGTIAIDVAAPVNHITINWTDGTTTTVHPPRPGTTVEDSQ
jgi:DNA-binding transcriptional MocR family regulator